MRHVSVSIPSLLIQDLALTLSAGFPSSHTYVPNADTLIDLTKITLPLNSYPPSTSQIPIATIQLVTMLTNAIHFLKCMNFRLQLAKREIRNRKQSRSLYAANVRGVPYYDYVHFQASLDIFVQRENIFSSVNSIRLCSCSYSYDHLVWQSKMKNGCFCATL